MPLPSKVAKMGAEGTVFSGMRLGLAGGVWRPLPSGQQYEHTICYNVYPPRIDSYLESNARGPEMATDVNRDRNTQCRNVSIGIEGSICNKKL